MKMVICCLSPKLKDTRLSSFTAAECPGSNIMAVEQAVSVYAVKERINTVRASVTVWAGRLTEQYRPEDDTSPCPASSAYVSVPVPASVPSIRTACTWEAAPAKKIWEESLRPASAIALLRSGITAPVWVLPDTLPTQG